MSTLFLGLLAVVELVIFVVIIAGYWKVFTKAGKPGWAFIIPIYNAIVLLQIAGKPLWWIVLLFIPVVNLLGQGIQCFCWFALLTIQRKTSVKALLGRRWSDPVRCYFFPILGLLGSAQYQEVE